MEHVLHTERLILRPVTAGDQAVLLAHWAAPEVRRFLFDGAALSAAKITDVIQDSTRDFSRSGYGLWLIHEKDHADPAGADPAGADLVGTAGLRPLEDLGPEIFYSLAPGSWGKGYATEAARAVMDHALGSLGLPEVLAEVDEGNTASIAVIERLVMTPFDVVAGLLGPMIRYRKTAGRRRTPVKLPGPVPGGWFASRPRPRCPCPRPGTSGCNHTQNSSLVHLATTAFPVPFNR